MHPQICWHFLHAPHASARNGNFSCESFSHAHAPHLLSCATHIHWTWFIRFDPLTPSTIKPVVNQSRPSHWPISWPSSVAQVCLVYDPLWPSLRPPSTFANASHLLAHHYWPLVRSARHRPTNHCMAPVHCWPLVRPARSWHLFDPAVLQLLSTVVLCLIHCRPSAMVTDTFSGRSTRSTSSH